MCSIPSWHSSPAWYTFIQQWNPFTWKPVHVQWHRKWNSYITIMFWTQMRQWIFGQCLKGPEQVVGSTNSNLNYALHEALTKISSDFKIKMCFRRFRPTFEQPTNVGSNNQKLPKSPETQFQVTLGNFGFWPHCPQMPSLGQKIKVH